MAFRRGCGWDREQRDECVKGGQPFKERSEQQSCGEVTQGMLASQGLVTVINERAPDSELEQ